jgi:hypothetical protein
LSPQSPQLIPPPPVIDPLRPRLTTPFPRRVDIWTDPITGLKVPKGIQANLEWRGRLLTMAEKDLGLQSELLSACAQSVLFWANAFVFTFKLKEVSEEGKTRQAPGVHAPFVTWEIQDRHLLMIEDAINVGYDLATDKSREMGASWDHILVIEHQFLFRPDSIFLELSRTEDYVDKSDNPKSLFWKHRYIRRWLPEWMLPPIGDVTMHFRNLANNSVIDGESTNANAASGDRRRAILLDEFAKVENGTKIRWATSDVTACRLVNSTPAGAGTEYSKWVRSGQIKVFVMPWWEHPEKGRGRYTVKDDVTGAWKIRAPFYDAEEARRSPQEMAQELDMNHVGSGATFFESQPIEQHRAVFTRPPLRTVGIDFDKSLALEAIPGVIQRGQNAKLKVSGKGAWSLWFLGRPDQSKNYIIGIDVSKGQGASNSIMSVLCAETREKVAEYVDSNVPPYELARLAAAAALWFGGARRGGHPLCIWEANGPGWDFGRVFVKTLQYPAYFSDKTAGTVTEKVGKKYGWHSSREKKEQLLGILRRAYAHGSFINHSEKALDEALTYVYYDEGGIGPAEFAKEPEAARLTHGDRVMADALVLLGVEDAPKSTPAKAATPGRSMAHRRAVALAKLNVRPGFGTRFDFTSGTPQFTARRPKFSSAGRRTA